MIHTERLTLRKLHSGDIDNLFAFLGDAAAMAFTHTDATWSACRRRVLVHEWFRRKDGAAPWVVVERASGQVIGWGGLYQDPFEPGDMKLAIIFTLRCGVEASRPSLFSGPL